MDFPEIYVTVFCITGRIIVEDIIVFLYQINVKKNLSEIIKDVNFFKIRYNIITINFVRSWVYPNEQTNSYVHSR